MVFGPESVSWGIQFSYPQIFESDEGTVMWGRGDDSPNVPLYKELTRWLRNATVPTAFMWCGEKVVTPLRLGKELLPWIHDHPELRRKQIEVVR
jgi:hypothetical protein